MRLPTHEELFNRRGLRWLKPFARRTRFGDFSAEPVARGIALGVFMAMMPVPLQTIPAVMAAVLLRGNIPIAAVSVWISNPLTWVPLYYFNYRVGAYVTGRSPEAFNIADVGNILLELWLGSLLMGALVGTLTYLVTRLVKRLLQGSKRLPEGEQRQVDGEQQAPHNAPDKTDH